MKLIEWDIRRLDELVNLWNKEISDEFPMQRDLFKQNSFDDSNVCNEGSLIAVDHMNQVVGFVVAKKWQDEIDVGISKKTGWIQVLLVASNHRNQGIGSKLLEHAELHLKRSGINHLWLGKDTWHYFPGIPSTFNHSCKWFEKRGYKYSGREYDLLCKYDGVNPIILPNKEKVELSLLNREEEKELLSFLERCFPGRWQYEAMQYFQLGGTGREFVVLKKNREIIGFCRINDAQSPIIAQNVYWSPLFDEELGGIGPLGIDANERKNGYGRVIVEAGVSFLRNRGIKNIVIDWTGLVDFYGKLGYNVWKSYETYQKNV